MSELIIIDSREKPRATTRIREYFDRHDVKYTVSKMLFGDYMDYNHPQLVIDRKQNIAELAKNCTVEHDRFRRELERVQEAGATMVILVEQNSYTDRNEKIQVEDPIDLVRWQGMYTMVRGEKVYRVLRSWLAKYPIRIEFCRKSSTGKRILDILREGQ